MSPQNYHICVFDDSEIFCKLLDWKCQFIGCQLQMLLFPNALCCSLYDRNCVCAVTQIFYEFFTRKQFLPTSAGDAQAQLHLCG